MGMFSDVYDEFKHGSPREKLLIVGGVLVVGGVAFYMYKKNQASGVTPSAASGVSGLPSGFQQGAPGGVSPTPTPSPTQGTTPIPPVPNPVPTPTPTPKPTVPKVPTLPTRQTTTVASVKASQPSTYQVKGVSPAPARVAAQRADIIQLRQEQAPPPLPTPVVRVTPAQTYLQVGNKKYY